MKITKYIQNLKCGGCAHTVKKNLDKLDGISEVSVDAENGSVHFRYAKLKDYTVAHQKLISLGYPLVEDENSFATKAKSYVSCAIGKMSVPKTSV